MKKDRAAIRATASAPAPARPAVKKGAAGQPDEQRLPRIRRNDITECVITALDEEGYGTARTMDGMTLHIGGGLPSDRLLARIDHVSRGNAYGRLHRLLEPSPHRSKHPPCAESADCLGCPLVAMRYGEQKNWKRGMVLAEKARYPELAGTVVHQLRSPENLIHYRTVAKLTVAGKFADPYIGIYRRATHDVYDLDECPIHHPLVNRVVAAVRRGITRLKVPIYNQQSRMGLLRYLVVRVSAHERTAMVVFVTARRSYNEIHHLARFVQEAIPEIQVVAQNVNSSEGNVILGAHDHVLTTRHYLTERIGETAFQISPRSFFQVNNDGARLVYEQVREWARLTGTETLLDLYCGIGGIALFLAPRAARVIGIEVVEEAVADARRNARLNQCANCRFEAGDAAELLEEVAADEGRIDVVVLNPPRKGCSRDLLRRVVALEPRTIIYVSCAPKSLLGDLAFLAPLGYVCREIQPVDMFPQTVHLESVALVEKSG
jgi:23S rRNA (uracil1939-C5)-methyltransferase